MENSCEISLNMKTHKGLKTYASFYLGSDEKFAISKHPTSTSENSSVFEYPAFAPTD